MVIIETAWPNVSHAEKIVSILLDNSVKDIEIARLANKAFLIKVSGSLKDISSILSQSGACGIVSMKNAVPKKFSNVIFENHGEFFAKLDGPVVAQ